MTRKLAARHGAVVALMATLGCQATTRSQKPTPPGPEFRAQSQEHRSAAPPPLSPSAPRRGRDPSPRATPFTEVAASSGISFRHATGGTGALNLLQTTGAGCSLFDYDNDGWLDLFLVGSARAGAGVPLHALYRNNRNGTFTDVTTAAGLTGSGYGMGCVTADYDGDGDPDLLVTGYGANTLYRNTGKGRFEDVTTASGLAMRTTTDARRGAERAHVSPAASREPRAASATAGSHPSWSTSAAFADYDGDGWLDLYVGRYLLFTPSTPQLCPHHDVPLACSPTLYDPQYGVLYHNNRDGTFTDVTLASGAVSAGRTLGVVWCDYDGDGRPDFFVANDNAPNDLFHNEGGGRFRDVAVAAGVAYGPQGSPEASMGVDFGDYDGDGRLDLLFTNFQNEGAGLYHNGGKPGFFASADRAGVLAATLPVLGFGAGFFDFDNDGHLDLFMANGHVQEAIRKVDPASSFAQVRQLFRNRGDGTFEDLTAAGGPALTDPAVGRGAAFGDYDNDGDVDILVNNNGGPAMLLRNELATLALGARRSVRAVPSTPSAEPRAPSAPSGAPHWLRLRLVGRAPNRFAIGARVTLTVGALRQVRDVRAGHSYASSSDVRVQFGLSGHSRADRIVVRWPGGRRVTLAGVPADREVTLRE